MAKALTAQNRKFKSANTACKRQVEAGHGPNGWPSQGDWSKFGSCMRGQLRKGRKKGR